MIAEEKLSLTENNGDIELSVLYHPLSFEKNEFKVHIVNEEGQLIEKFMDIKALQGVTRLNERVRLHLPNEPIGLFVHSHCMILNILYIKMILMTDKLIIYDLEQTSDAETLVLQIQNKLVDGYTESFEFLVLDLVLNSLCDYINQRYEYLYASIDNILKGQLEQTTQKKSLSLLPFKHELKRFSVSTQSIHDSLNECLKDDDILLNMCLSAKKKDIAVDEPGEMEDLVETYYFKIDQSLDKIILLENKIKETDDTIEMILNINRNHIMKTDVWNNFINLAVTAGGFLTVPFTMNLVFPNGGYDSFTHGWIIIFVLSCLSIPILIVIFKWYLNRSNF